MVEEEKIKLEECAPAQGLIELYVSPSGDRSALIISGGDNKGTESAANYMAARIPYVWELDGIRLEDVEKGVNEFLSDEGITVDSCNTLGIVVEDSREEVKKLKLSIHFEEDETLLLAEEVLLRLASAHSRGERGNKLSYPSVALLHLRLKSQRLVKEIELPRVGEGGRRAPSPEERRISPRELSLSKLYSVEGLLGASGGGFIPDGLNTVIIVGRGASGSGNIAARLGLESTGVHIPIAKADLGVRDPKELVNPILVGRDNSWVRLLIEEGKLEGGALRPGEGLIQVAPKAFGEKDALALLGGDEEGLEAACTYLSERLPHLWEHRKGEIELGEIEEDVRRFFSSRIGAGQAAAALYRLERILGRIQGDLEELSVQVFVEGATPGLGELFKEVLGGRVGVEKFGLGVGNLDRDGGVSVIDEILDLPWEVDDLWERLRVELFPRIREDSSVSLEVRVSEPPEIRERLREEISRELIGRGCDGENVKVTVLSAYKQGYSLLYDIVLPSIKDKGVNTVKITFAPLAPREIRWQKIYSPIRWLQELYPIDEVLSKELAIPVENIVFESSSELTPIYRVEIRDREGKVVHEDEFDPKFVVQPFLAKFPDYEKVRVTTGWVRAEVDGETVLDERIITDPEKFWSYYQEEVLGRVFENVMDVYEGTPLSEKAPYFNKLEVELWMSEPDYPIGVDQEQISSLEALHEDIYFETLTFFNVLGLFYSGQRISYLGRVIPRVHSSRTGRGPTVKVRYLGKAASNPKILVHWKTKEGVEGEICEDIVPLEIKDPRTISVLLKSGREGVVKLGFVLEVDMMEDRREELVRVASPEMVDRQFSSAEKACRMAELLGLFHQKGLYLDALSYPHLERIEFRIVSPEGEDVVELENPLRVEKGVEPSKAVYEYRGERIVQWEKPISPEECQEIISKLDAFPEVTAYRVGQSYLGREVWAMDVMLPVKAGWWSQAKASAYKPV
ncbi:MAG: hypothetical protein ACETVR_04060, partial [Candidatus Bathyarchaeia archaeon]